MVIAPLGQTAIQCPQAMQPTNGVSRTFTFPSESIKPKSLQTSTHIPQPLHFSEAIAISARSFVLDVGIAILILFCYRFIFVLHCRPLASNVRRGGALVKRWHFVSLFINILTVSISVFFSVFYVYIMITPFFDNDVCNDNNFHIFCKRTEEIRLYRQKMLIGDIFQYIYRI